MKNRSVYKTRYYLYKIWPVSALILGILFLFTSPSTGALDGFAGGEQAQLSMSISEPGFELGDSWLNPYSKQKSLDDLFKTVAEQIRFEPYEGILRGVMGTAISHRGNSLDQALLLRHVLSMQGYQSRLVTGRLNKANSLILLRGMYPPQLPEFSYSELYNPFKLEKSEHLINAVSKHYWVEVNQGTNQWLPLDPSFPRAKIGEAYAEAEHYYEQAQDDWKQIISIRLMQKTKNNKAKTVFDIEMPVSELGYIPLSLSCMGAPLEEPAKKPDKSGSSLGLFGKSLNNSESVKKDAEEPKSEPRILGTQYDWALRIRGQGSRQSAHSVQFQQSGTLISKEWLEITIKTPGHEDRNIQRVLYEAPDDRPEHQPSMYRRYVLEVLPGIVRPELAEAIHAQFIRMPIEDWKQSMAQSHKTGDFGAVVATDEALASRLLQMILTRFAEASDEASDRAAYRNGVAVIRSLPRVLIASAELENKVLKFSMDLRLDEVEAIPFPGMPSKATRLFQMGRGILESIAEGQVLQQLTAGSVVTTSSVMSLAQSDGIPLKVVDVSGLSSFMKRTNLPLKVRQTLMSSLIEGREIIIPEKPVRIAGVERWGWWQIEKASGRNIGVMDNGLHAGMAEYTISTKEIGLNPRMGFVVGMIVGADSTLFSISGLMIKHGQVTPALIKEVKAYLEKVMCSSCPKAEAKAGSSISVGGDCLKVEAKDEIDGKVAIDFCEQYIKGFKCAAGLLMAGLTGESVNKAEVKIEASYEVGCTKGKGKESMSHGL